METEYKPDLRFLQAELKRVSDLIQFTDRKTTFLMTFYSAVVGLLATQKSAVLENLSTFSGTRLGFYWLTIVFLAGCFSFGIYHLVRTMLPSFKHERSDQFPDYYSIIRYRESSSEDELRNHMTQQIHTITLIANRKMTSVHKCSRNLFLLVFLAVVFVFVF